MKKWKSKIILHLISNVSIYQVPLSKYFGLNLDNYCLCCVDEPITETAQLSFNPDGDENELLEQLRAALKLQESSQNIIKLRLEDDTLIPLSALLGEVEDR